MSVRSLKEMPGVEFVVDADIVRKTKTLARGIVSETPGDEERALPSMDEEEQRESA